jgi:hypothetical protein
MSGILALGMPLDAYKKRISGAVFQKTSGAGEGDQNLQENVVVRQFPRGYALEYSFVIYNAQLDAMSKTPKLTTQVRLFRNGQPIFEGKQLPYEPAGQSDPKRLSATGALQLSSDMEPGDYVLQLVVTDTLAKGKHGTATQWVDFEIVK